MLQIPAQSLETGTNSKVDKENTTSFSISAGSKELVGNSDGSLSWGGGI